MTYTDPYLAAVDRAYATVVRVDRGPDADPRYRRHVDQAMIALVIQLGGQPPPYRPLWPTRPDGHPTTPPGDGGHPADITHP